MSYVFPPSGESCWLIAADGSDGDSYVSAYINSSGGSYLSSGNVEATFSLDPTFFAGPIPIKEWNGTSVVGTVPATSRVALVSAVSLHVTVAAPNTAFISNTRVTMQASTTTLSPWTFGSESPSSPLDLTAFPPVPDVPWNQNNTGSSDDEHDVVLRAPFASTVLVDLTDPASTLTLGFELYPWEPIGGGLYQVDARDHTEFFPGGNARLHAAYLTVSPAMSIAENSAGTWNTRRRFGPSGGG